VTPRRRPLPSRRCPRSAATGTLVAPRLASSPSGLCSVRRVRTPSSGVRAARPEPIPSWSLLLLQVLRRDGEERLHAPCRS
jgi:hypothetical protein